MENPKDWGTGPVENPELMLIPRAEYEALVAVVQDLLLTQVTSNLLLCCQCGLPWPDHQQACVVGRVAAALDAIHPGPAGVEKLEGR